MQINVAKISKNDSAIINLELIPAKEYLPTLVAGLISVAPLTRSPAKFSDGQVILTIAFSPELDYQPCWNSEVNPTLTLLDIKYI